MTNGKVFIERRKGNGVVLEPLDKSVAECLSHPSYQGVFYARRRGNSASIGLETERAYDSPGWIHFATNHGLSYVYTGTTQMVDTDAGLFGYRILHLTDGPIYFTVERGKTNLIAAYLKIMDGGNYFRFDGTFDGVLADMKNKGFRLETPKSGTKSFLEFADMVDAQRKGRITDKLVEDLNKELFMLHGDHDRDVTMADIAKQFCDTYLF